MKQFKNALFIALAAMTFSFMACQKDDINPNQTGSMTLEFDNIFGGQNLTLNSVTYKNAAGEDLTVSMFNYFISNIKLQKDDGTEYVVPQDESYFLVKEAEAATHTITLKNIPEGNYNGVKFIIGVDSLRNTMDVSKRTGNLDIAGAAQGMYWSWNSGYIFVKMEGTSPSAPLDSASNTSKYRMHIGGFGGLSSKTINNIKETSLKIADVAKVRSDATPKMHVVVDAAKVLNGSTNVSFKTNATTMFNPFSVNVANNYVSMFTLDHIHN
jgi:hypothetical protein